MLDVSLEDCRRIADDIRPYVFVGDLLGIGREFHRKRKNKGEHLHRHLVEMLNRPDEERRRRIRFLMERHVPVMADAILKVVDAIGLAREDAALLPMLAQDGLSMTVTNGDTVLRLWRDGEGDPPVIEATANFSGGLALTWSHLTQQASLLVPPIPAEVCLHLTGMKVADVVSHPMLDALGFEITGTEALDDQTRLNVGQAVWRPAFEGVGEAEWLGVDGGPRRSVQQAA